MFRIKICGVTRPEDALAAAQAGADAIGLNFYPKSPRFVGSEQLEAICAVLPDGVAKVGVFVNASADAVRTAAEKWQLDYVQLHGDELPELVNQLDGLWVIRACRLVDSWQPVVDYLSRCRELDCLPVALLADSCRPGTYGGTGATADWDVARGYHKLAVDIPLILAGGLRPDNVAQAIAHVQPFGVDTASGVESSPGVKDTTRIAAFVAAARGALAPVIENQKSKIRNRPAE